MEMWFCTPDVKITDELFLGKGRHNSVMLAQIPKNSYWAIQPVISSYNMRQRCTHQMHQISQMSVKRFQMYRMTGRRVGLCGYDGSVGGGLPDTQTNNESSFTYDPSFLVNLSGNLPRCLDMCYNGKW